MTTIIITPELLKQLGGILFSLELSDADGRFLGTIEPSGEKFTYDQMMATCPYTEEELDRLAEESTGEGRPLADILRDLEAKWPSNEEGQIQGADQEDAPVKITVTPELLKQLNGLISPLEFRDAEGRLLGSYEPSGEKLTYDQMMATCPYSEEELAEMARSPATGQTTAEILQELREKWPIE